MEISDLKSFAKESNGRLRAKYASFAAETEILHRMCKVTEEVGEMSDEVLKFLGLQRQEKLDEIKKDALAEEMADVILTVLLVADLTGADMEAALASKIKKVRERNF